VLLTQPALYGGNTNDSEKWQWGHPVRRHRTPDEGLWLVPEASNGAMWRFEKQQDAFVVNVARQLPKTTEVSRDDRHSRVRNITWVAKTIAEAPPGDDKTARRLGQ
jgi:hypothetical protein